MRRWLVLLMLAFLPLQFSWSAVAAYCSEEAELLAGHAGPHEHAHDAEGHSSGAEDHPAAGEPDPAAADSDCNHCHGHCTGMLADFNESVAPAQVEPPAAPRAAPTLSRALAPPERPQWPRLA